jgi:hypothetical protein
MNGVQEAESSNLSTQTMKSPENIEFSGLLLFCTMAKNGEKLEFTAYITAYKDSMIFRIASSSADWYILLVVS